jgi:hypothetical protein
MKRDRFQHLILDNGYHFIRCLICRKRSELKKYHEVVDWEHESHTEDDQELELWRPIFAATEYWEPMLPTKSVFEFKELTQDPCEDLRTKGEN